MRRAITKIQRIADAIAVLHRQGLVVQTDEEIATAAKLDPAVVRDTLDQSVTLVWGKLPIGMIVSRHGTAPQQGVIVTTRGAKS